VVKVFSWGRLGSLPHEPRMLVDRDAIATELRERPAGVAHGMGRSYGDVCLNPGGALWMTAGLDRFIAFDIHTGRLRCEAGVQLGQIQRFAIPRGWILPVTPGTWMATVGGAIANDVHGKNHHVRGSFGDHVRQLRLVRSDGEEIDCGPGQREDWFAATVGGLGLTGIIAQAEIQLMPVQSPWLDTETIPYTGLDAFFALADASEGGWEYTVSWIDCLAGARGRGLFIRGNHASASAQRPEAPALRVRSMPFVPPVSLVNGLSLRLFNFAYYQSNRLRAGRAVSHYRPFFYPLDAVADWNRMYGPHGFFQHQSVVPRRVGRDAIGAMLDAIARSGEGSFLAVLKTFGERTAPGLLSFARPGVTLALDFPNRGERTAALLLRLDAIVAEAGGRLYPAKDASMSRAMFEAGYPALSRFLPYRDPKLGSAMSRRLMGH
jgi:FAD/FMN-containing dehydrogenase